MLGWIWNADDEMEINSEEEERTYSPNCHVLFIAVCLGKWQNLYRWRGGGTECVVFHKMSVSAYVTSKDWLFHHYFLYLIVILVTVCLCLEQAEIMDFWRFVSKNIHLNSTSFILFKNILGIYGTLFYISAQSLGNSWNSALYKYKILRNSWYCTLYQYTIIRELMVLRFISVYIPYRTHGTALFISTQSLGTHGTPLYITTKYLGNSWYSSLY
jgi:hypothetical protein